MSLNCNTATLIGGILLFLFLPNARTYAQCTDELAERYHRETRTAELKMLEAKQTLQDKDPGQWLPFEIQSFEYYSLWVVYAGTMAYIADHEFDELPQDLSDLALQGYILEWPENPYHNWESVEVLSFNDGFSAGNIAIEPAPASHRDGKSPYAFEMVIYGSDAEFATYGSAEPLELNLDWATAPEGALYMLGAG